MPRPISSALRTRIRDHLDRKDSTAVIHQATGVSVSTINRIRKAYRDTGSVMAFTPGRPQALSNYHAEQLMEYLNQRPTAYQDEMVWFLFDEFGILVDQSTISRALSRRHWSRKVVKRQAAQPSEALRMESKTRMAGWTADQLVFLDENAACERTGEFN